MNAASLALMAAVSRRLGVSSLTDPVTVAVAAVALVLIVWKRASTTCLNLGGAAIGIVHGQLV